MLPWAWRMSGGFMWLFGAIGVAFGDSPAEAFAAWGIGAFSLATGDVLNALKRLQA